MVNKHESAHDKFLRLMQRRLGRVLEELRLVRQLNSKNYESLPEEREEVILHLDRAIHQVAQTYDVPYESRFGAAVNHREPQAITQSQVREIINLLDYGRLSEALAILRKALPAEEDEIEALLRKAATAKKTQAA